MRRLLHKRNRPADAEKYLQHRLRVQEMAYLCGVARPRRLLSPDHSLFICEIAAEDSRVKSADSLLPYPDKNINNNCATTTLVIVATGNTSA